jgi:hypothetical protein
LVSLLRLLFSGFLGSVVSVVVAVVLLLIAAQFQGPPRPTGYMDPSAAVGEARATLLRASAVIAIGACLGVIADVVWRSRRTGHDE